MGSNISDKVRVFLTPPERKEEEVDGKPVTTFIGGEVTISSKNPDAFPLDPVEGIQYGADVYFPYSAIQTKAQEIASRQIGPLEEINKDIDNLRQQRDEWMQRYSQLEASVLPLKETDAVVREFLQRKDEITRRGKEGGFNVFEEYGKLLEEYTPRLPEGIATILQRAILVERAYDVAHQRSIVVESDYRGAQETIRELTEKLEQAKTGADSQRVGELEEQLRNAQQELTNTKYDYAMLERVADALKEEKERFEAAIQGAEGKATEYQLELKEAKRQNVGLFLETESLSQKVSNLEERIRNAKSAFQEQERGYLGNIERLNQEIRRLEGMLKSDAELEVVGVAGDGTRPFEDVSPNTVSAPENANLAIDYQQVLGAVAYTIDKLFFSIITRKSEREKISNIERRCRERLEEEFKRINPYKQPENKKIDQWVDYSEWVGEQKKICDGKI